MLHHMRRERAVIALSIVVASVAVSAFACWLLVSPSAVGRFPAVLARALNTPPAIVGAAYGRETNGNLLSAAIANCDFCTPREHLVSYFAAAIPAYVIVFGAMAFTFARLRKRSSTPGT